ncbi:hypothetical protein [Gordonia paraffinivorans]|uniref:hypothetical protein n=1 Tax=Gordonia paraffinivorans TaxID=175628 RepID=UPI001447AF1A|nr:hypothetical protein [Gordonia paraffinivorans]
MAPNPKNSPRKSRRPKVAGHTRPARPTGDDETTTEQASAVGESPAADETVVATGGDLRSDEETSPGESPADGTDTDAAGETTADETADEPGVSLEKDAAADGAGVSLTKDTAADDASSARRPVSRVPTLRPRGTRDTDGPGPAATTTRTGRTAGTTPAAGTPVPPRRPGETTAGPQRGGRRTSGLSSVLTIGFAVAAVVLGIVAAILAFHPGAEIGPNEAFVEQKATAELTGQAQERICAVWGHQYTDLDAWAKRAGDALTGDARKEFDESLKTQRELITQTKSGADCRVDALGVKDMSGGGDGARATVIANLIISETRNGMATNSLAPRAQFSMVKQGDTWRIEGVEVF